MNKRQKLVLQQFLNNEEAVIGQLKSIYGTSLEDVNGKIKNLTFSIGKLQEEYDWLDPDDPERARIKSMIQSKIYQKQYQEQLQRQIDGVFSKMKLQQYTTVSSYLDECYEDGFIGSLFDAHGQGVPITTPINQESMVRAVQLDSKISKGLYTRLGEDVDLLKKKITAEVTRSIATGRTYQQTAQALSGHTRVGFNNAVRIARTEGHRIQCQSAMDAMESAKERGADILKQWDATLDGRTRESHAAVDMEIRELDKPFSNGLMFPGDPSGKASEVINCRCSLDQRARWEFDDDDQSFTKFNNFTGQIEEFESPQAYDEFKKAFFSPENRSYMNNLQDMEEKYGTKNFPKLLDKMDERDYQRYSKLLAQNPIYNLQPVNTNNGKTLYNIGGVDCTIDEVAAYDFGDGNGGIMKTVPAKIYTTSDGTKFVYPKDYDDVEQTLTPEMAISAWQRVPENIRIKIQKTVEVVDYYNPTDAYWQTVYKNFTHSYATGGERITFYRSKYHDPDYLVFTFCHEGGHYIDYHLPGSSITNRYCQQAEWQLATTEDLRTSGKKSWRDYGENSALEDFADSVGYYTLQHSQFMTMFPERAKLLDKILK